MKSVDLIIVLACFSICLSLPSLVLASDFTEKDRALLIRMDERLNQVDKRFNQVDKRFQELRADMNARFEELRSDMNKRFEQVDKRFEQVNKRFEQVDKRFEQVNKRFEQVDKRFDDLLKIMLGIIAAFAAIVAVTIGFAIWDRRTMIRPFEDRTKKIEDEIIKDRKRLNELIDALRKYAKEDKRLAEILKSFALL